MEEFQQPQNDELSTFVVSVYLLGYDFGPMILAPLSELYGRNIVYHVCNVLYLLMTIACALASNLPGFMVCRLLAGAAGSAPLFIGAGSRGYYSLKEPRASNGCVGARSCPWTGDSAHSGRIFGRVKRLEMDVLGCLLYWEKRAGAFSILAVICLRETHPYTLLRRKTKSLQRQTGNRNIRSTLEAGQPTSSLFMFSILRPMKMPFYSPIVSLLALYIAVIYGYLYLLFTTFPSVFLDVYHFSSGDVGLIYLGIGVGSIVGMIFQSLTSDMVFQWLRDRHGFSKPEYRLLPLFLSCWMIPFSLFWYGWAANKDVLWISPIISTSLMGLGMVNAFTAVSTYLVDAYTEYAASAIAATIVLRSIIGAFLPLAGGPMYKTLGLGWGNSVLTFIALAMCPLPFLLYRFGERIRKKTFVTL
ncbi:hypothetical protein N7517_011372 [Penicillium concentricum]|uniref:Major facilitator superfamily (MFS) profile domain-containing protein n=1 Tax=Penicillium concentricum TaxID=293559 RepID=A0A9W9RAX2_9EURO|nr:uncharacterized protein N7517_011372 [Penicillium concentricum]KAJ5356763.1 hypothetical protein N7517_011372 [Penicillium concentricum]